jgi:hypothetical protein
MKEDDKNIIAWGQSLYEELQEELIRIVQEEQSNLKTSEKSISIIIAYLNVLKKTALSSDFIDKREEIQFFKEVKPLFNSELIFHISVLKIESKKPEGSFKTQRKYLYKQLDLLKIYFDENVEFYQYYRNANSYLDEDYFLRNKFDMRHRPEPFILDCDATFSTTHDFKVARILANEKIRSYLNATLAKLEQHKYSISKVQEAPKKKLIWTGSKTALIELAYGLQATGVFNNSNADVKHVADYLQSVFNVDLGNYYRTFQEIRIRKSGRTNFVDQLKKKLIQRMDETGENLRN